jgi:hypothetical protein
MESSTYRTWHRRSGGSWSVIDTLGSGNTFVQVHGSSNSAVYACGNTVPYNTNHFVRMWNGATVSQIYTSSAEGAAGAIFSLSDRSVWYAWLSAAYEVVIEYWNGSTWTEQHRVNYGEYAMPSQFYFADATHGWLVCNGSSTVFGPILYWNGSTWVSQALPARLEAWDAIYGVHGSGATDVYATVIDPGRLLHYDGVSWSDITPADWSDEWLEPFGVYSVADVGAVPAPRYSLTALSMLVGAKPGLQRSDVTRRMT